MLSFFKLNQRRTWLTAAAVLISFLSVPLFSLYFWKQLSGNIDHSEQLRLRTETALNLLGRIDSLKLAEAETVNLTLEFIESRKHGFIEKSLQQELADAADNMSTQVNEIKAVISGLPHTSWNSSSLSIQQNFASLESDFILIKTTALQSAPDFVASEVQSVINSDDEFAELDSLVQSAKQQITRKLSMLHERSDISEKLLYSLVLTVLELDSRYSLIRSSRHDLYVDTSLFDLIQSTNPADDILKLKKSDVHTGSLTAVQPLISDISLYSDLLTQRYALRTKKWIISQGQQEIELAQLTGSLDAVHSRLIRGLTDSANQVRSVLDADVAELSGTRRQVQSGLIINGGLTVAVSLLMVFIVLWVLWQMSNANKILSEKVSKRTAELAQANKDLEDRLVQLQTAQEHLINSEKTAALAGLVAGVAHEINTPLGVAITAATFQQDKIDEMKKSPSAGNNSASFSIISESNTMVVHNLERAADLVRNFKQVAVDQSRDDIRDFILDAYISDVLFSLSPAFKKSRVKLRHTVESGIYMHTYAGALSQIITNLVLNALNHAFPADTSGTIDITGQYRDDHVEITVSDDGCGIPEENKAKIFEPFFTTSRNSGGTGLGLFIVKNLVSTKLGGSIRLLDSQSTGTSFLIVFPPSV